MHALTEIHFLSQTLAAVFQVDTQEHLITQVLLGLSKTCIQLQHTEKKTGSAFKISVDEWKRVIIFINSRKRNYKPHNKAPDKQ